MSTVIDLIILGLVAGVTYALMSEGLWGAALMFFNVLFAALISLNFYEPVAQLLVDNASFMATFADSVSLMVLFIVPLLLLRLATESMAPAMVRFPTPLYHLGRVAFGLGAGVIAVGMVLLGYQASPVQKTLLGVMDYKYKPFYTERFDRDILAFFQYTTGNTFARNGIGEPGDPEFPARPLLFDPKSMWLLEHQKARPYGEGRIIEDTDGAAPAAGGAPAPGAAPTPAGPSGPSAPSAPGGPKAAGPS